MRVVFFGTPQTSVPFLDSLLEKADVAAVVTQTDKPSSRGQELRASPVKALAQARKIPVLQPSNLKDPNFLLFLASLKAEAAIVVAYGRILPPEVIRVFPKGLFNIHFSLLPQLRGGAPIQRAILAGLEKTGVSSFRIAETLDTGNILVMKDIAIAPQDDAVTLEEKLVPLGLAVMKETLALIEKGDIGGKPQTGEASQAPLIKKEETRIDWNKPARDIGLKVRAFVRLGAFCKLPDGKTLKILKAEAAPAGFEVPPEWAGSPPGTVCKIERNRGFVVKCNQGFLVVLRVQLEGKKETDAWPFLQGCKLKPGDRLM